MFLVKDFFRFVLHEDLYRICVGNMCISAKTFASIPEAESYVNDRPWELIINVAALFVHNACMAKNEVFNDPKEVKEVNNEIA